MPNRLAAMSAARIALVAALVVAPVAAAQENEAQSRPFELMVGDAAPKLAISEWIKGEPVSEFKAGKVYVVEFWATWCGPCIQNIPHLSEIQKEYAEKGLAVISVTSPDPRNSLERVRNFVERQGDKMGFTVAFDDAKRTTDETWMNAAGQMGIPATFVVDAKGRIAWIGHPALMDEPLARIVAGTHDIKTEAVAYARSVEEQARQIKVQQKFQQFVTAQLRERDYEAASKLGRELVAEKSVENPELFGLIAWTIVDPQLDHGTRDLELALDAATRAVTLTEWQVADPIDTLAWVYYHKKEYAKAIEIQEKALAVADVQIRAFVEGSMRQFKLAQANAQ